MTDCATQVPPGTRAALAADVVCEARCSNDPSIVCGDDDDACGPSGTCVRERLELGLGSTLAFHRHRVSFEYRGAAILCGAETFPGPAEGRCSIDGPGLIQGNDSYVVNSRAGLRVRNLTVASAGIHGVDVLVENVRFHPFTGSTLSGRRVWVRRTTIGSSGVIANEVILENVTLEDWSAGIYATFGDITGHDVRATGSAVFRAEEGAIDLRRLRMGAVPPPPPGQPPQVGSLTAQRVRLVDSSVSWIYAEERPDLLRAQCERSGRLGASGSWGVCSGDPGVSPVFVPPIQPTTRRP